MRNLSTRATKPRAARNDMRASLLVSSQSLIVLITSWFAIALDEIRTRRILREKADWKQSMCCEANAYFIGSGYAISLSFFFSGCRPRFSRLSTLAHACTPLTIMKIWRKRQATSLRTTDVSPLSSPLREVLRGGTSATQRQKFHTDDAKSVRNPVRSADWSTE